MAGLPPRAVLVTRETDYERLLAVHATREQARFFLKTRGQDLEDLALRHAAFGAVLGQVRHAIPDAWRVASVMRADLDRFLFAPEDVVIAVGQDGLVANLAKYLDGQPVVGVNPAPDQVEGVLAPFAAEAVGRLLPAAAAGAAELERRTMAEARLDDGQTLMALNEVFIGHQSHQSARYEIELGGARERQSSSGLIVATGTGATGWARSITTATHTPLQLSPAERALTVLVREAWPSLATGASLTSGPVDEGHSLVVTSQMNEGGVIFADGIEQDRLDFGWGRRVTVAVAARTLNLVRGA
jgi:NAD kinase